MKPASLQDITALHQAEVKVEVSQLSETEVPEQARKTSPLPSAAVPSEGCAFEGRETIVWDQQALLRILGDDEELIRESIDSFLAIQLLVIRALAVALEQEHTAEVYRLVHSIQGAAATVGGEVLRAVAGKMEQAVAAENLARRPAWRGILDAETIDLLFKSAPLHDIGKVAVPDRILCKPGPLTAAEFAEMKGHALIGAEILDKIERRVQRRESLPYLRIAREVAVSHHEKWNGSGYPGGLKGEATPLTGRIMALADVYDALTSARVYKPAFSHEKARRIILEGRGSFFDPDIVDAFLSEETTFQAISRKYSDGV